MTLSQGEINKSAVMAAIFTKEQSVKELKEILDETATEELFKVFEVKLRDQLAEITNKSIEVFSDEFMTNFVGRICRNAGYKLTSKLAE